MAEASFTEPWRLLVPATNARASTKEVLPLAPWPTTATLRISAVLYTRMGADRLLQGGEKYDAPAGKRLGQRDRLRLPARQPQRRAGRHRHDDIRGEERPLRRQTVLRHIQQLPIGQA